MALIYPLVYFKQSQYMSEGCVCVRKSSTCMNLKEYSGDVEDLFELTHYVAFLRLKTISVIAKLPFPLHFNDLRLPLSAGLH